MVEVGDTIKIEYINDPFASDYSGRVGVVQRISKDPWGDTRIEGTWGGLAIYPSQGDAFKVILKGDKKNA